MDGIQTPRLGWFFAQIFFSMQFVDLTSDVPDLWRLSLVETTAIEIKPGVPGACPIFYGRASPIRIL